MTPHSWNHLAYIGPGAGFALAQSFLTIVLSILAAVASAFLWPFRIVARALRRRRLGRALVKRAIFLGLDGLDAGVVEKLMGEGKLPNLARLSQTGSYRRLRTTFPALSPVAWSTFATGVNPGKHNIFDFLNRDLRSYVPELSSAKVHPAPAGKGLLARPGASVEMRRKSEPFWKILGDHAVSSTILRVPVTFPPEPFEGRLLSAMCTPDVRGTQGEFTLFRAGEPGGLEPIEGGFEGRLGGPASMTLAFRLRSDNAAWALEIDDGRHALRPGEYTGWIRLRFRAPGKGDVPAIARFLLSGDNERPSLYVTPVQIDPENPALPISQPGYFSVYLAKLLGSFATLGLAEDTTALNAGAIDGEAFLQQVALIQKEREAMFFNALDHLRDGVVACVFDTSDRVQHMFYRDRAVIENMYADMDRLVGDTLRYASADTAVFVLSDHGFCSFRRGVNLNAWLHQNGYLALDAGGTESGEYFVGVDWSRTSAYTFGLGGLYLNLRGREAHGIVAADDAATLRAELIARLADLRDGENGPKAIRRAYSSTEIYAGPYLNSAPDLVIGYEEGYRASWDAAVGRVTADVFEENSKAWCGDHCVDPELVPGVLFSNRKIEKPDPGIEDLAPTALALFGIAAPAWMEGASVVPVA